MPSPPCSRAAGPRPHVFGMTASPANIRVNQGQAQMEANIRALEANLAAKVGGRAREGVCVLCGGRELLPWG